MDDKSVRRSLRVAASVLALLVGGCGGRSDAGNGSGAPQSTVRLYDLAVTYPSPNECLLDGTSGTLSSIAGVSTFDRGADGSVDAIRTDDKFFLRAAYEALGQPEDGKWVVIDRDNRPAVLLARGTALGRPYLSLLDLNESPFDWIEELRTEGEKSPMKLEPDNPTSAILSWTVQGGEVVEASINNPQPQLGQASAQKTQLLSGVSIGHVEIPQNPVRFDEMSAWPLLSTSILLDPTCGAPSEGSKERLSCTEALFDGVSVAELVAKYGSFEGLAPGECQ